MRRFKRAVEKAGIPKELRSRAFHQKGSVQNKDVAAAKKRWLKKLSAKSMLKENSGPSSLKGLMGSDVE